MDTTIYTYIGPAGTDGALAYIGRIAFDRRCGASTSRRLLTLAGELQRTSTSTW